MTAPGHSGKDQADENFPVAVTWLLGRERAEDVKTYYAFARMADDIADAPDIEPEEKVRVLESCAGILEGKATPEQLFSPQGPTTKRCRDMLMARAIPVSVAADLIKAFKADALNTPCPTLPDLMTYCQNSAAPVGRFLLHLCETKPSPDSIKKSDALCSALQVLNHVQDWAADWDSLKRCYLPLTPPPSDNVQVRTALTDMLDLCSTLLAESRDFADDVTDKGLKRQIIITQAMAERLFNKLQAGDPVHHSITLTKWDKLTAVIKGLTTR